MGPAAAPAREQAKPELECNSTAAAGMPELSRTAPGDKDQEQAQKAGEQPSSKLRLWPRSAPEHAPTGPATAGGATCSDRAGPSAGLQALGNHAVKDMGGGGPSEAGLMQHAEPGKAAAVRMPNTVVHREDVSGTLQQALGAADAVANKQLRSWQGAMVETPGCLQAGADAQDLPVAGLAGGSSEDAGHAVRLVEQGKGPAKAHEAGQAQPQGAFAKQPGFLSFPEEARRARSQPAGTQMHR